MNENTHTKSIFFGGAFMIFVFTLFALSLFFGDAIRLEDQHVPEAINGVSSAVAILVGLIGVLMPVILQITDGQTGKIVRVLILSTFCALMFPIVLLVTSYVSLFGGYFQNAVISAMVSLLIASSIFIIWLCIMAWIVSRKDVSSP